jgi:hypothetical protein
MSKVHKKLVSDSAAVFDHTPRAMLRLGECASSAPRERAGVLELAMTLSLSACAAHVVIEARLLEIGSMKNGLSD